jgi:hypothetical protein
MASIALVTLSCGNGEPSPSRPACLSAVDVDQCSPLYPPEFPELFQNVFSQTCASGGGTCHGPNGRQGGLVFADESEAYDLLLGQQGNKTRVNPGDAACSELIVRLDSVGQSWSMPPGAPLKEGARCSIRRWVALGAPRQ